MVASLDALNHTEQLLGHELHHEKAKWFWKDGAAEKAVKHLISYNKRRWDPHVSLISAYYRSVFTVSYVGCIIAGGHCFGQILPVRKR